MSMSSRVTTRTLYLLFFLSGACALIYENIWFKVLRLILGNTTYALSTVLASFMAGLALGSWLFGKYIDSASPKASKERNPIIVYGLLEIAIGILCLGTVYLKDVIESIYLGLYRSFYPPVYGLNLIRFTLSFLLLVIPTMCMGGTLPVLSKFFIHRLKAVGKDVAVLYALNTLGACTGVIVSGFILFPNLGISRIILLTAATNVLIGVISLFIARAYQQPEEKAEEEAFSNATSEFSRTGMVLLLGFGLSGVVSMVYEISWTRMFAMLLGSSAYAFSIMLATFLCGLFLGSLIYKQLSVRIPARFSSFGILQILIAASVVLFLPLIQEIPFLFVQLYKLTRGQYYLFQASTSLLCALVMLVPTILIGMTFPLVSQLYANKKEELGGQIGRVYAINTIGNIVGALIGGFLLVPTIGVHKAIIVGVSINCAVGLIVWLGEGKRIRRGVYASAIFVCLVIVSGISMYPWPKKLLTTGIHVNVKEWRYMSRGRIMDNLHAEGPAYYKDGLNATISVKKTRNVTTLKINGKPDASTLDVDMATQTLLAYVPILFADDPKTVFILGLGSGVTASACADFPVERIDIAEIEEAIVEASEFFKDVNKGVLRDKRVHLYLEDGRNYLLREKKHYDVLLSEPPNPWMEGVASLFTKEYYQLLKDRLTPQGVACQWVQLYGLERNDLERILRTFNHVFPYMSVWKSRHTDLLMIGSDRPLKVPYKKLRSIFKQASIQSRLTALGFMTPRSLISAFLFDQDAIIGSSEPINTDDFNRLEYSAPRALFKETSDENQDFLFEHSSKRSDLFSKDEDKKNADTLATRLSFVVTYLGQFDFDRATFEVKTLMRDFPDDIEQYFNFVLALQGNSDDVLTFQTLQRLIQRTEGPKYYYFLGLLYNKNSMFKDAEVVLQKAIALAPQELKPHLLLGRILREQQKYKQALEVLRQALVYHPSDSALLNSIRKCEQRLRK